MLSVIIEPSVELEKLIKRFMFIGGCCSESVQYSNHIPLGFVGIVFNFKSNKSFLFLGGEITGNAEQVQNYINSTTDINSFASEILIVLCYTDVFCNVFKTCPETLFENSITADKLFDDYPMLKALKDIRQNSEKALFFENFLLNNTSIRSLNSSEKASPNKTSFETESDTEITSREVNHTHKINYLMFHRNIHLRNCLLI